MPLAVVFTKGGERYGDRGQGGVASPRRERVPNPSAAACRLVAWKAGGQLVGRPRRRRRPPGEEPSARRAAARRAPRMGGARPPRLRPRTLAVRLRKVAGSQPPCPPG